MKLVISLAFMLMASCEGWSPVNDAVYGGRLPTYGGRLSTYPTYDWEHTPYEGDDLPIPTYYPKFGKYVPKYLMEKYGVESDIKKVVDYKKKVVPMMTMDPLAPEVDVNVKVPDILGLKEKRTDIKLIPTSHYVPTTTPLGYPGYPINPEYILGSPLDVNYRYPYGVYNYKPTWFPYKFNPTMTMHPLLRYISGYPYNRYPVDVPESYNSMPYFYKYMSEMYKNVPTFNKYLPMISKYYPEMFNMLNKPEFYKYLPMISKYYPEMLNMLSNKPEFYKYLPMISKYYPEMFNMLSNKPEFYKHLPEVFWNFPETFKTYSDFYKYMPEVLKYYPEIYKYMPVSYYKYYGQTEVPEVVYKYIYDMMKRYTPEIYGKHIPEIFNTYFPEVFTKYTPDILNVYNPEMHTIFRKYITSVLEHPEIEDMKKDILRSYLFRYVFTTPYSFLHDTIYSPEYELMRYVNKVYTPLTPEYTNEI